MNKTRQFTTSSNLIVCTWNAGGVRTHLHELGLFLRENDIGVLLLTETHLATGVTFYIPVYTVFRKDRIGRRGGGVAVCIRSSMPARRVDFVTQLEAVSMETEIDGQSVIFLAVYIPPKVLLEKNDLQSLFSHPRTLVGGDFNCKHPAWGSRSINTNGRMLYKFITSTPGTGLWAPEDCTSIPPNNKMGDVLDFFLGYKI